MEVSQKYVIETKKDQYAGQNCFLASLRCIMEHYGCRYSEVQLFFISNSFKIRYGNDLNEIGRYTMDGLNEFSKRTHITITTLRRDAGEMIPEKMLQMLKCSMIMLDVDTKYLNYSRLYSENENRKHLIVLYGIDINEKTAHIMDLYMLDYKGNVTVYQGKIPLDVMTASASRCFCFSFDNKRDLSDPEILQYARTDLQEFIAGSEDNGMAIGSLALRNFLKDIVKLDELDNQDLASTCSNINYYIKIRSFNLINKYLMCFLDENKFLKAKDSEGLLASLRWHFDEWEKIGFAILRIGISKRKGNLVDIYEKCIQLFSSQMKVYEHFSCLLNTMVSSC